MALPTVSRMESQNGHANGVKKDEPLDMVTALLLSTFQTCEIKMYC